MLRASIEKDTEEADLAALTDGEAARDSSIPGAAALVGWVEATLEGDAVEVASAREGVARELGPAAMVDAAAVIGNFERMVRIADGTGIPLDAAVNVATESIRAELGVDDFESASNTADVKGWQRAIGRVVEPAARAILKWRSRRA